MNIESRKAHLSINFPAGSISSLTSGKKVVVGLAGVCSLIYLVWFPDPAIYLLNDCMFIHSLSQHHLCCALRIQQ